jgi:SpoVK/Ycf46/Vps4 family AAA+-type ATPase
MVYVCRSFEPTPIRHVEAVDRDMLVLPDAVIDELEENVRQTLSGVNIGGLGRRKTYNALLHGEPGTCKSTAIEFVAHKVRAHILLVPSNNFHLVAEFRSKISGRALVVLEDVHTQQFRRTVSSRSQRSVEEEDDEQTYDLMSVVLGTLDGLESIPGTVFLFTANREWVRPPPAELLRRFHGLFHFTHPTVEEVRPFLQKVLQGIASEKRDEYVNTIVKVIENSKEHSDKFVVRTDDHPRKGVSTCGKALMRVKMYALKEALRFAISRSKDGDLSLSLFQLKWVNLHEGVARSQAHLADA